MQERTERPLTGKEIAERVHDDPAAAAEILEGFLERIASLDPRIGAFEVVCDDAARRAARDLVRRADVAGLPLAGVPVAVKDNVAVAGLPTRHGSRATGAARCSDDDELVRRLRAAGAIVVGKTRMPELAAWSFTESLASGGTANPWDPDRNAGGSTGGGAAAVAAGMAALALGSDGGGSLRIPAAYCGVVAYKPARGRIPLAGGLRDHWFGCTAFGTIAGTVADAALADAVLAGRKCVAGPPPPVDVGSLRVAMSWKSPSPFGRADRTARDGVLRAAETMRAHGHEVRRADPPYPVTLIPSWCQHWLAGIAEEAAELDVDLLEPRTRAMVRRGNRLVRRGRPDGRAATAWMDQASRWFETYDVLVTPTVARQAPRRGALAGAGYARSYVVAARSTPFTQAWNLAGFPALTLPMGISAPGMPLSVQLVTPPGREAVLLALAAELEAAGVRLFPPLVRVASHSLTS